MSKIAHYLQEHLVGEVTDSLEVRRYFSRDSSILQIAPAVVVFPSSESDVRKTARFSWQLAQRGKLLPITARGGGSDTSGAAIGSGIILAFTAHMNRILAFDTKKEVVVVEPGITYNSLQQALYTHGFFLPPYPASGAYATLGGGLANNSIGEKSVKYGDMRKYVERLSVVLANGEVIETGPLNKRELNKKLGLSTLEGEIYRGVDALLEEYHTLIQEEKQRQRATHNRSGYNLFDVKKKGAFDLTPLFLGSQGSLGIITEASLRVIRHNPATDLAVLSLNEVSDLHDIIPRVMELKPSICEMINKTAIEQIHSLSPNQLNGILGHPSAAIHLIIEFDDEKEANRKRGVKALKKLAEKSGGYCQIATTADDKEKILKLRRSVATLIWQTRGGARAIPVAEDISVPTDRLTDFLQQVAEIYAGSGLVPAVWGHAAEGVVRTHPVLDLAQIGDRQKMFKLTDSLYNAAVGMGGSVTASAGDGRVRAPYLRNVYGEQMSQVMLQIKNIFDQYGILNRGVKTASAGEVKSWMRTEYGHHRHDHLPLN